MSENLSLLQDLFNKFKNENNEISLESFKIIVNIIKLPIPEFENKNYNFNDLLNYIEKNYKIKNSTIIDKEKIINLLKPNLNEKTIEFILKELSKYKNADIRYDELKKYSQSLLN